MKRTKRTAEQIIRKSTTSEQLIARGMTGGQLVDSAKHRGHQAQESFGRCRTREGHAPMTSPRETSDPGATPQGLTGPGRLVPPVRNEPCQGSELSDRSYLPQAQSEVLRRHSVVAPTEQRVLPETPSQNHPFHHTSVLPVRPRPLLHHCGSPQTTPPPETRNQGTRQ